jgi:hypothetical protein
LPDDRYLAAQLVDWSNNPGGKEHLFLSKTSAGMINLIARPKQSHWNSPNLDSATKHFSIEPQGKQGLNNCSVVSMWFVQSNKLVICPLNQAATMLRIDKLGSVNAAALERTMKLQEVILKAMAKKISWLEEAEIIGVCDRTMRRMRDGYQKLATPDWWIGGEESRVARRARVWEQSVSLAKRPVDRARLPEPQESLELAA